MDEKTQSNLRDSLRRYPGATEDTIEQLMQRYEEREYTKIELVASGYSNRLAETYLDRKGFPRPPGWHSAFFYPGSDRPRNIILFWAAIAAFVLWKVMQ